MSRGFLDEEDEPRRESDRARRSDLIDVTVTIHAETAKAWLMSDDGTKERAKWVPKSQGEFEPTTIATHIGTLTCPEWLAKEKGFI